MTIQSVLLPSAKGTALRPFQARAVNALLKGCNVVCVAPTGTGKSRIYQEYLGRKPKRAIIVTPLNSLGGQIERQMCALAFRQVDIRDSGFVTSLTDTEVSSFLVLTPERLFHEANQSRIAAFEPELIIIDEAHCIFDWGKSFRPQFSELLRLHDWFPTIQSLWLSATLTRENLVQLRAYLESSFANTLEFELTLGISDQIELSFVNLNWQARLNFLKNHLIGANKKTCGIIFSSSRLKVEALAQRLKLSGVNCQFFHAGMSIEEKASVLKRFSSGDIEVLVSTVAFGMGMDFSGIEWVVLFEPLHSIASTVQALGRSGRANIGRAFCFFEESDWLSHRFESENERCRLVRLYTSFQCRRVHLMRELWGAESVKYSHCRDFHSAFCDNCK